MRHIILNLEAPLMAFGGETIDNLGVIRPFPAASMLTGLLANALGWRRIERERHQSLQDRLIFAARIDREPLGGLSIRDFQTAELKHSDKAWTTRGSPEGRAGGANTYNAPHLRFRDYQVDGIVTVALRLEPEMDDTTLDDIEAALEEPARPLFIGRKPCLPSKRLFAGYSEGDSALEALLAWPLSELAGESGSIRTMWPQSEGVTGIEPTQTTMLTDERNWISGLHGGGRVVCQRSIEPQQFGPPAPF